MNSPLTQGIIVHSYKPIPGRAEVGGFDFAIQGSDHEAELRAQFDLQTDTAHHDYTPTHEHRLLRFNAPGSLTVERITQETELILDTIEAGEYDHTTHDLGRHIPTNEQETPHA